ncbi:DNA polymerase IV [Candidatus Solincola tengchongensis]|uniref:DNA polymerase IV n=1 Tax=Candidatus Solincola tengchongensis TaxID=2900693 RepID=UPI00257CBC4D|nr:DNA polymerase IV [Candidatus Solincola tengchongensis]
MTQYVTHGLLRAADQVRAAEEGRCVLHLDMDAYFASVEQRDVPLYRGRPLVVCHTSSDFCTHGVVATASYEARRWGVKAGMSVWEARSRCPHACFVHADIPKYLDNARRIRRLCERLSHRVEVFSIDEVFVDLTPLLRPCLPGEGRWREALRLGRELKGEIRRRLGLTASVGIGPNKLVAKMASEFQKPDGLTLITPEQLPDILAPLPVDRLVGVGERMRRHLRAMGVETVGDLARTPVELLEWKFGVMGRLLWEAAHGRDGSPVREGGEEQEIKSFGHSLSLRGGTRDLGYLENTLLGLCDAVTRRMRREGYLGRTVSLRLRVGYALGYARTRSLAEYTDLTSPVYAAARDLLRREAGSGLWTEPVTTVGVSVTQLRRREEGRQITIWECLDSREERLTAALDALRDRYGEDVVTRASLLGDFALSGMNLAR